MKFFLFLFTFKLIFSLSQRFLDINTNSFNAYIESNKYNNNKKLFLIFYKDNITFCEEALNIIEKEIIPYYRSSNNLIDFGKINCDLEQNIWLNIQFKITRIPYIILIIGNYFYELYQKPDKYTIKDFIDNINAENNIYNKRKIPKQIGTIQKVIIVLNYIIKSFRYFFYRIFKIHLHKNIIIFLLLIILFSFFWLLKILFCLIFKKCRYKCKKKEQVKKKVKDNDKSPQVALEEELKQISPNLSESEINDENDKKNIINDDEFNQQMDDEEVKQKYKTD